MRGSIKQRSEGSWSLIFDLGPDPLTGKRRQKWVTVKGTRKDAERELRRLLSDLDDGAFVEPHKLTFGAFLQRYLTDHAETTHSRKTVQTYREFITRHIAPALGGVLLAKLTPAHLAAYQAAKLKSGRLDGNGGLSAQTVLHHHRLIRAALQVALKWGLVNRNVADAVEGPKVRRKEPPVLDGDGSLALLEEAKGTWLYLPILIGITTGLRRGEVLGLKWEDLDLEHGRASIRRSLEQTSAGIFFKEPKSGKARVVALPLAVLSTLRAHKARQAELRLLLGKAWEDRDLVVCYDNGALRKPENLTHAYYNLRRRVGCAVTFQGLRHSHATILLTQGVQPKVVSERLGHSSTRITQDIYSHVMPHIQDGAAAQLDAALANAAANRKRPTLEVA